MIKRVIAVVLVAAAAAYYFLVYKPDHPAFTYAGTIEVNEVDIQPGVASTILSENVQEGQVVSPGTLLATLTCPSQHADAALAVGNYQRARQLYHTGSMSFSSFDAFRTQNQDAQVQLGYCTILSPISGTVLTLYHYVGEWARPGDPIMTLANLRSVYSFFYVPQPELAFLKLGQAIPCSLPEMPGRVFQGTLAYIRPEAEFTPKNVQTREERERLIYGVKVHFDNDDGTLKPGMYIEAKFPH